MLIREVELGPHVVWVDNFSKHIKWQLPKLHEGMFKACLWTGVAYKQWSKDEPLDMTIKLDPTGARIPAMPNNPFLFRSHLRALYVKKEKETPIYQYERSMVVNWEVNNVPLKPLAANVPARYHAVLEGSSKLNNLYPSDLIDLNVGANDDFFKIFKKFYEDRSAAAPLNTKYNVLMMDCNIYDRLMKVC